MDMKYNKNGLSAKEYYTEGNLSVGDKIKAARNQKYYTGGAIIFMFIVLISTYAILN